MPFTVGDLLRTSTLDIRPMTGGRGLSKPIRWVHVSELEDPTPWLKGGELLLTTGMNVGKTPARQRAYIGRLVEAGLSGLGFGTGFSFGRPARALVEAARSASFPLFEVPYDVPFIAITEAVFTRIVAEQYDLLSRSLEAEHALTRAVLEDRGVQGIIEALGRATRGWAVLLDRHGTMIAAHPAGATAFVPLLQSELRSARAQRLRFSLSVVERGQHVSIQPVPVHGRAEAHLSVGKKEALTQFDRIVSSHAVSLLALEVAKARAVAEAERRLKGDLLDQLLRGAIQPGEARTALERVGFDVGAPAAVLALSGAEPAEEVAAACEEVLSHRRGPFLVSPWDDLTLAVIQPDGSGFLAELHSSVAARLSGSLLAGAGGLVGLDALPQGVREARYALQVCRSEGRPFAEFADLGTYQLLLSLQDPEALRTFADSVLAALDRYDRDHGGDLVLSLRAFLEKNARWEAAARQLLVHRHTLRYRMRKVEELSGRNLSSARDRMEFFLALRARDMLSSTSPARAGRRRSTAGHG